MRLTQRDFIHGAALIQIVNHPDFTALNRASDRYGHYLVNHDRRLFVKYSTMDESPWYFNFLAEEVDAIAADAALEGRTFFAGICGDTGVCLLSAEELFEVLDQQAGHEQQQLRIEKPPHSQFRAMTADWELDHTIPASTFPGRILE